MRIAEHRPAEPCRVPGDLRICIERGAAVVEIRNVLGVEPREFALPQVGHERIRDGDGVPQHPLAGLYGAAARLTAPARCSRAPGVPATAAIAATSNAVATTARRTRLIVPLILPP